MPPPAVPPAAQAVSFWLLLRAFAAGCTAMTGVEAVSNGVGAFREPRTRHAHGTLAVIVAVLALLLGGIAYLCVHYGIAAMDQTKPGYQSVLSQLVAAVHGRDWLYYVVIGSVLAVLCLSANTSFVGFPRLCRQVASDGYLPSAFAVPGRRLVYTAGILFLAGGAGLLLTAFGGITDRLIPLFAVGAFLSFTLSQAGMAAALDARGARPRRPAAAGDQRRRGGGDGVALLIILAAKFVEGAWITVLVIPLALYVLRRRAPLLRRDRPPAAAKPPTRRWTCNTTSTPRLIIPIARWDRVARNAVTFAMGLSPDVIGAALHRVGGAGRRGA